MGNYDSAMNRLRGIGILLVIIGHSIFFDLIVDADGIIYHLARSTFQFIYSFHMPLFFFISGFFAVRLINVASRWDYAKRMLMKFKRLMVPYITLTIIATVIKIILSSYANRIVDPASLIEVALLYPLDNPMKSLWYIYTLFFILLISPILGRLPMKISLSILLTMAILPYDYGLAFNLNGIIRNALYFYLGFIFNAHYSAFLKFKNKTLVMMIGLSVSIMLNNMDVEVVYFRELSKVVTAVAGIICAVIVPYVMDSRYLNEALSCIGEYSYDIYLLSWFAQQPIRILYQVWHLDYSILLFLSFLAAFVVIPISKYLIRQSNILSVLLIGGVTNLRNLRGSGDILSNNRPIWDR